MNWDIIYYKAKDGSVPSEEYLDSCPFKVQAKMTAALDAVAKSPPPRFSGGGLWEAMHGEMSGFYEVRVTGPGKEHHRLFCMLENGSKEELEKRGLSRPAIAVITGMKKKWATKFSSRDYAKVRKLGEAYISDFPRRVIQS